MTPLSAPKRWGIGFILLGAAILIPPMSWAHGGTAIEKDECRFRAGAYSFHFTGYQPEHNPQDSYCGEMPATGRTIVVLDYLDRNLRELPVELSIMKRSETDSGMNSQIVLHIPPATYPSGSLSFEHNFDSPGEYVGILTVGDDQKTQARFEFAVGVTSYNVYTWPLVLVVALGGLAILFYIRFRKRQSPDVPS